LRLKGSALAFVFDMEVALLVRAGAVSVGSVLRFVIESLRDWREDLRALIRSVLIELPLMYVLRKVLRRDRTTAVGASLALPYTVLKPVAVLPPVIASGTASASAQALGTSALGA
jgi:hypothetical protein